MKELPSLSNAQPAAQPAFGAQNLSRVRHVIAISSGKGGVGKSTVSVNLALALARTGAKVGLMDADVYGPSVPKMLGGALPPREKDGKLLPIQKEGIAFMSMALLTNEDSPVIWRGPMATKLIQHFLTQVEWGELDYLLIDLPPGTGDVQLTLTQGAPLRGAVIVTTPQDVAVSVALRGIRMFDEVRVPILGIVENMSGFVCSHCDHETPIFKSGGGEKTAEEFGFPFLGKIPIDPKLTLAADEGDLSALDASSSPARRAIDAIAARVITEADRVQKLTEKNPIQPSRIDVSGAFVTLSWSDGLEGRVPSKRLRFDCPCAVCVDEDTGERKDIRDDVTPRGFRQVGRYGVQISWSDGHATGIYTFERLRDLSEIQA